MRKPSDVVTPRDRSVRRVATAVAGTVLTLALLLQTTGAAAQQTAPNYASSEALGVAMEGWSYPYPLETLQFEFQSQPVRMLYMDLKPAQPNGQTVLLFHGKNFGSDYWAGTMRALSAKGYRVIAPDQIGFGKSSKPELRCTFEDLADHTARLLDQLQIPRVAVIANSMGGMLGVHFSRRYSDRVTALVLENPLGLEDYRLSIPAQTVDNLVKLEMAQTPETYRRFLLSYFPVWTPAQERFVEVFARVQKSGEYPRFARVSALTYQMIHEGPIVAELPKLSVPTLLAIGQLDRTVFGRRFAPPEAVKALGNFVQLGKTAQKLIPGARLVEFEGVGHVPHLEVPELFHAAVLEFLASIPPSR